MGSFKAFLGVVLLVALASVATGCGKTVIDTQKTEEQLQASLSKSLEKRVKSVECPSQVEVKAKSRFSCTVELQGGETGTATLEIRNEDADVSVVDYGGSGGSNE